MPCCTALSLIFRCFFFIIVWVPYLFLYSAIFFANNICYYQKKKTPVWIEPASTGSSYYKLARSEFRGSGTKFFGFHTIWSFGLIIGPT